MSDYPQPEQQSPEIPPKRPPAPSRRGGGRGAVGWITLMCAVLALVISSITLYRSFVPKETVPPPAPPEPPTIAYRDMKLPILEQVPVNDFDPDGFSLDERGRVVYEENGQRAPMGIDVSYYQQKIDWQAVAADGAEFAIIRLGYRGYTEGGLMLDQWFAENLRGAAAAGLEIGVYFFSQAITPQEAREEAAYVVEQVKGHTLTYPVVFDWEFITPGKGARTDQMDGATLTQCALAFCEEITDSGYTPMVYFNQDMGYLTLDLSALTDYPFWLAEYRDVPSFYYGFSLWQYTHSGQVNGIQGDVDWNLDLSPFLKE